MPMTDISHRPNIRTFWPWVVGAFLLGAIVMVFMPPLPPVAFVALTIWYLARADRQNASSRKVAAVAVGLILATALYQIVWFIGNISR
jgi:hypothetical protein